MPTPLLYAYNLGGDCEMLEANNQLTAYMSNL